MWTKFSLQYFSFFYLMFLSISCSFAHLSQGYNSSYGNICSYCFHANSRVGDMGKYFPIAPTLSRRRGKVLSYSSYSWGLRDMQPSPISLLIKRDFVIFENVPLTCLGIEPRSLCITVERLTIWTAQAQLKMWQSFVQNTVNAAIAWQSLYTKGIFQAGYLLWIFELWINSRPTPSYLQWNS